MKTPAPTSLRRCAAAGLALAAMVTASTASTALASLSATPDATTPQTNGRVHVIMRVDGVVYVGGSFSTVRPAGKPLGDPSSLGRPDAFAFDAHTGAILPWNPKPNGVVRAMAANPFGSEIFLGGNFTTVGGKAHNHLAATAACVNHSTCPGAVQPWAPGTDGGVYALAAEGNTLYVGGLFKRINNVRHRDLGAVTISQGKLTRFAPSGAPRQVRALLISPGGARVFVGGNFQSIGSSAQNHLAALNAVTGAPGRWRDHPPYAVLSLAETSSTLWAAGAGGGGHMRSYRMSDGHQERQTVANGNVSSISMYHGEVLAVGHFTQYGIQKRKHVALINGSTGKVDLTWAPELLGTPLGGFSGLGYGQQLYVGGDFLKIDSTPQQSLASFSDSQTDTTAPTITRAPDVHLAAGTTLGSTLPVTLSWGGSDNLSGVCRYMVQQATGSGGFVSLVPALPTALSMPRSLTPNVKYSYRASAKDCSDNVSSSVSGPGATVAIVQNSNSQVKYGGSWRRNFRVSDASGGSISYTSKKYANVQLSFTGRQIAWVASKSTTRGRAWVYVDGKLIKVVDLHANHMERRQIVFTRAFAINGPHRIRIFNQATRGRSLIDLDAFVIVR
jgi:hypothetical protein